MLGLFLGLRTLKPARVEVAGWRTSTSPPPMHTKSDSVILISPTTNWPMIDQLVVCLIFEKWSSACDALERASIIWFRGISCHKNFRSMSVEVIASDHLALP
ncbi:hypothetical protein N7G274_003166 [Stereocaulon virgatum]|uniref:Uncharacterized protein n=1 Tax=Stereocaulon virgatum TaxID=373712 RepID=A0ABR4AI12_9LECA